MKRLILRYLLKHSKDDISKIYIMPSSQGMKLLSISMLIFIIGMSYANNYVLIVSFFIFSFMFFIMFYSYFNLKSMWVNNIGELDFFMGVSKNVEVFTKTKNFIGNKDIRFTLPPNNFELTSTPLDIAPGEFVTLNGILTGKKRGQYPLNTVLLESSFPFGLFNVFQLFRLPQRSIWIYPFREELSQKQLDDIFKHNELLAEDILLREFKIGDSLKRVDWKKLAQKNQWYTKYNTQEQNSPIVFEVDKNNLEISLGSIGTLLLKAYDDNIPFGIKFNDKKNIPPSHSLIHLKTCLRELAIYEE